MFSRFRLLPVPMSRMQMYLLLLHPTVYDAHTSTIFQTLFQNAIFKMFFNILEARFLPFEICYHAPLFRRVLVENIISCLLENLSRPGQFNLVPQNAIHFQVHLSPLNSITDVFFPKSTMCPNSFHWFIQIDRKALLYKSRSLYIC